jgi:hypothetical protein
MRACKSTLIGAILCFHAGNAWAVSPEDAMDDAVMSMGWAGIANPESNSAPTVNPGLLGLSERYHFGGQFAYGPHPQAGWAVTAVDSRTIKSLAIGVTYNRSVDDPELAVEELPGWIPIGTPISNRRVFHDVTLAAAVPLLDRRISFGVNGTVSIFDHDRLGNGLTGNLDTGLGIRPVDFFTLGLAGRNLLPIAAQTDRPATLSYGLRLGTAELGGIEVNMDQILEDTDGAPWELAAGLEKAAEAVQVRGGWRYDGPESRHWLTLGLGAGSSSGSLGYSIALPLTDFTAGGMIHQISLRVSMQTDKGPDDDMGLF